MQDKHEHNEHDHDKGCQIVINCGGGDHHKHCKCPKVEFAEVYSVLPQTLTASPGAGLPGQMVLMERLIYATAGIDVSMASINGQIKILEAGWYDVTLGVTGALNPLPSPLPAWTVSLFKNGVLVDGSTFANLPLSPEQQANECISDVFVHCDAGDILTIANTSDAMVFLTSP